MSQTKIEREDRYGVWVNYHDIGSPNKISSGAGGMEDTLDKAKGELIHLITFYENFGCQVTKAYIFIFCKTCDGTGKVYTPGKRISARVRKVKEKRCPACRGKESQSTVEVWVDLPKELFK